MNIKSEGIQVTPAIEIGREKRNDSDGYNLTFKSTLIIPVINFVEIGADALENCPPAYDCVVQCISEATGAYKETLKEILNKINEIGQKEALDRLNKKGGIKR